VLQAETDDCHLCPSHSSQVASDERSFMAALAQKGPLAVAIEADQQAFQFYAEGVFTATCGDKLDHGVALVGYGLDDETKLPFFKIKNRYSIFKWRSVPDM
jgi:hypothetical protein